MRLINCVNMYFSIILTFCFLAQVTKSQRCDRAQTCITDLVQAECGVGFELVSYYSIFGCCPGCRRLGEGGGGDDDDDHDSDHKCRPPFNCLSDGTFAPVQCKGDMFTGRCFCTNKDGNRIFGQMWRREASGMTCACSRARDELETDGHVVTMHCTANGDYELLQCNEGMCWCVEPTTGQPNVIPIPEADMHWLPCYSSSVIGEQYLRRCESIVFALETIYKEQSEHGTNFYGNPTTFCDYDGSYGPYQIQNGIAYCTGRDGKILGSWQVIASEMAGINCNCARDTSIIFPDRGMTVSEVCEANGNYRPNQIANGVVYCVDSDGYPIDREDWPSACTNALNNL